MYKHSLRPVVHIHIAADKGFTRESYYNCNKVYTLWTALDSKIHKTDSPGAGPVYQQTVGDEFLANLKPKPAISSTDGMEGTPPFMQLSQ